MLRWLGLLALPLAAIAQPSALDQSAPGDAGLRWIPQETGIQGGALPNAILQLAPSVAHVLLVDLRRARLYLLENDGGTPRVLRHMYSSMGRNGAGKERQGDGRTPVGVYTITDYIDDANLPELYGNGAYPLDYPNAWDRSAERTGYGIWVHGVPRNGYQRPPRSSEGCVTVANADLDSLGPFIEPGRTPVVFSDRLEWIEADRLDAQREELLARIDAWEAAWESLDTERYLTFYAADFRTADMDRAEFAAYKARVNANKRFIALERRDDSLYHYPDGSDIALYDFEQDYRSDNYSSTERKQLFWRRGADGEWQIVQEIAAP